MFFPQTVSVIGNVSGECNNHLLGYSRLVNFKDALYGVRNDILMTFLQKAARHFAANFVSRAINPARRDDKR